VTSFSDYWLLDRYSIRGGGNCSGVGTFGLRSPPRVGASTMRLQQEIGLSPTGLSISQHCNHTLMALNASSRNQNTAADSRYPAICRKVSGNAVLQLRSR
jgi:hypothetical protein